MAQVKQIRLNTNPCLSIDWFTFRDDYDIEYLLKSHRVRRQVRILQQKHLKVKTFPSCFLFLLGKTKYLEYYRDLNSHPDYTETWNNFWSDNSRAYEAANKSVNGIEFINHWKRFWCHRLASLEEEDVLKIRVNVRKQMNLVIEPRDLKVFKRITMESQTRSFVSTPTDSNYSERSSPWSVEQNNWPVLEEAVQAPQAITANVPRQIYKTAPTRIDVPTPKIFKTIAPKLLGGPDDLTNDEIAFLFTKYKDLSDIERRDLKSYMEILKEEDDERFKLILSLTKGCGEWLESQITGKSG